MIEKKKKKLFCILKLFGYENGMNENKKFVLISFRKKKLKLINILLHLEKRFK